jgi:hypothetical protein
MLGPCSRARLRLRALRAVPARALPLPNAGLAFGSRGMGGAASGEVVAAWAADGCVATSLYGVRRRSTPCEQ